MSGGNPSESEVSPPRIGISGGGDTPLKVGVSSGRGSLLRVGVAGVKVSELGRYARSRFSSRHEYKTEKMPRRQRFKYLCNVYAFFWPVNIARCDHRCRICGRN